MSWFKEVFATVLLQIVIISWHFLLFGSVREAFYDLQFRIKQVVAEVVEDALYIVNLFRES